MYFHIETEIYVFVYNMYFHISQASTDNLSRLQIT